MTESGCVGERGEGGRYNITVNIFNFPTREENSLSIIKCIIQIMKQPPKFKSMI